MGKKTFRYNPWGRLERGVVLSPAYAELTAASMYVFSVFLIKRKLERKGRKGAYLDNGDPLVFTYGEAESLGISKATHGRALRQLEKVGFIDCVYRGGICGRDYSRYRLSERYRQYGKPDFREAKQPQNFRRGPCIQEILTKKVTGQAQIKRLRTAAD